MTIKPRTIRSLRDVRERMRDVAAAHHGRAAHACAAANEHLAREENTLVEYLDDVEDTLSEIKSVYELDRIAAQAAELRRAVATAVNAHETAKAASDRSAMELRERARQLRSLERLKERLDQERARTDTRNEQMASDDMVAARRR